MQNADDCLGDFGSSCQCHFANYEAQKSADSADSAICAIQMLILFSVWRTDSSNAKFATFSLGKTNNTRRHQAADILMLNWSDVNAATDTGRWQKVDVRICGCGNG